MENHINTYVFPIPLLRIHFRNIVQYNKIVLKRKQISHSRKHFLLFLVPIVEILNATTFTSLRSMASKLVETEEMGNFIYIY